MAILGLLTTRPSHPGTQFDLFLNDNPSTLHPLVSFSPRILNSIRSYPADFTVARTRYSTQWHLLLWPAVQGCFLGSLKLDAPDIDHTWSRCPVYETLIYLLALFVLPISFIVRPGFCGMLLGVTSTMYILNVLVFNEIHLRLEKERINWVVLIFDYTFYKIALAFVNVFSYYWSLYKYARYFVQRHPKVIEDQHAIGVVLSVEPDAGSDFEDVTLPMTAGLGADAVRAAQRLTLTRVEPDHHLQQPRWPLADETMAPYSRNSWNKRISWI